MHGMILIAFPSSGPRFPPSRPPATTTAPPNIGRPPREIAPIRAQTPTGCARSPPHHCHHPGEFPVTSTVTSTEVVYAFDLLKRRGGSSSRLIGLRPLHYLFQRQPGSSPPIAASHSHAAHAAPTPTPARDRGRQVNAYDARPSVPWLGLSKADEDHLGQSLRRPSC
jgi:hypothetical protein